MTEQQPKVFSMLIEGTQVLIGNSIHEYRIAFDFWTFKKKELATHIFGMSNSNDHSLKDKRPWFDGWLRRWTIIGMLSIALCVISRLRMKCGFIDLATIGDTINKFYLKLCLTVVSFVQETSFIFQIFYCCAQKNCSKWQIVVCIAVNVLLIYSLSCVL